MRRGINCSIFKCSNWKVFLFIYFRFETASEKLRGSCGTRIWTWASCMKSIYPNPSLCLIVVLGVKFRACHARHALLSLSLIFWFLKGFKIIFVPLHLFKIQYIYEKSALYSQEKELYVMPTKNINFYLVIADFGPLPTMGIKLGWAMCKAFYSLYCLSSPKEINYY